MSVWKAVSPTIRNCIIEFLLQDLAVPKGFNEINRYLTRNKICSRRTLKIYLEQLEKEKLVDRVKMGKRFLYAVDSSGLDRMKFEFDMRKYRKVNDRIIRLIRKAPFSKDLLVDEFDGFTRLQIWIFKEVLEKGMFWDRKFWDGFLGEIFWLKFQVVRAWYEKYPKETLEFLVEALRDKAFSGSVFDF